jgi:hypothetical protein
MTPRASEHSEGGERSREVREARDEGGALSGRGGGAPRANRKDGTTPLQRR